MTAQDILDSLAQRYAVPPEYGNRFLDLVGRSLAATQDFHERTVSLIESSFRREEERLERRRAALVESPEWKMVLSVARVLHAWQPSGSSPDSQASQVDDIQSGTRGLDRAGICLAPE